MPRGAFFLYDSKALLACITFCIEGEKCKFEQVNKYLLTPSSNGVMK